MYGLKTLDLLAYLYLYSWNPFYESYLDSEHIRKQTAFAEQFEELKQTNKKKLLSQELQRERVPKKKNFLISNEEREIASVKYIY